MAKATLSTSAALTQILLLFDALLFGFVLLGALFVPDIGGRGPWFLAASGLKVLIAAAWLVWLHGVVQRAARPDLPSPTLALLAFVVPIVRLVAPGWVMWRLAQLSAPRLRWLVLLWLPTWHLGRLAVGAGDEPGMDVGVAVANLVACFAAMVLVQRIDLGVAVRGASDSLSA